MGCYNCLHPRKIIDSRGQERLVRCGHCEACENIKAFDYTTQCKLESQSHNYTLFVTLTYNNENLPLVKPYLHNGYVYFNPLSPKLIDHFASVDRPFFAVTSVGNLSMSSIASYNIKFALPEHLTGLIPVLDKVDLQNFIKRLRYYLSKKTNEKIRYYAVGEYGPVHYRPHYHLLLWYDEAETASFMGKAISEAWKFGRVDYQISKGDVASYVAQYANSISSRSRLHAVKYLRPFVLHSSFLFGSFYQDEEESLFDSSFACLNGKGLADNGRFKQVSPSLSFESRYFGRCINYDQKNHNQRLVCFTFAAEAAREFGQLTVDSLARLIYHSEDSFCYYLMSNFTFDCIFKLETIKSVLYRSRRFLRFCDIYHVTPDAYVSFIERYWQDKDYYNLCAQLSDQEYYSAELGSEWLPNLLYYYNEVPVMVRDRDTGFYQFSKPVLDYLDSIGVEPQFFTNLVFDEKENSVYKDFASKHLKMSYDRIKHKRLNDLNKIFL